MAMPPASLGSLPPFRAVLELYGLVAAHIRGYGNLVTHTTQRVDCFLLKGGLDVQHTILLAMKPGRGHCLLLRRLRMAKCRLSMYVLGDSVRDMLDPKLRVLRR
jgi:hypothetical protein